MKRCFARCLTWAAAFAFVGPMVAHAANPISSTGTITELQTGWFGEGIYITISPQPKTPVCPQDNRIFMPTTAPQYKDNLAILLILRNQQTPVSISYNTTCNTPPNGTGLGFVSITW
jgi:hypothetical protein